MLESLGEPSNRRRLEDSKPPIAVPVHIANQQTRRLIDAPPRPNSEGSPDFRKIASKGISGPIAAGISIRAARAVQLRRSGKEVLCQDGVPDPFCDSIGPIELRLVGRNSVNVDADFLRFGQYAELKPE